MSAAPQGGYAQPAGQNAPPQGMHRRRAVRQLRRNPGFVSAAMSTTESSAPSAASQDQPVRGPAAAERSIQVSFVPNAENRGHRAYGDTII
ncbi:hypothetical protein [Clostridium sp. CAG:43]|uniref:hypothetical protein n=1 Tax=Clostridium sp. CAG:43 TaxID=1262805 RepID=UPI000AFB8772